MFDELQIPLEINDSLVEGFGPKICNRKAILQDEIDKESGQEGIFLLKDSEQRMHLRTYNIFLANTEEYKARRRECQNTHTQTLKARDSIENKVYNQSEADKLVKASERRMHIRNYHMFWANTDKAKTYQKAYLKDYYQRPEVKANGKELRQDKDYKKYHRLYVKEYRKLPYVQEREDKYLARPEVKERMKETERKQAKTEKRRIYVNGYHRGKKFRSYQRGYESNKRKTDANYFIAYRLRKSLRIAMKKYGEGKKYSSKFYGIDFKKIVETLGKPPEVGQKYHIDHIRPCCSFDLTKAEEVKKCFAPENLRWLPAVENLRKISQDRRMSINKKEGCS